jgi:hypothetical protein
MACSALEQRSQCSIIPRQAPTMADIATKPHGRKKLLHPHSPPLHPHLPQLISRVLGFDSHIILPVANIHQLAPARPEPPRRPPRSPCPSMRMPTRPNQHRQPHATTPTIAPAAPSEARQTPTRTEPRSQILPSAGEYRTALPSATTVRSSTTDSRKGVQPVANCVSCR